jgi:iron complex transport system substrate-binding protein
VKTILSCALIFLITKPLWALTVVDDEHNKIELAKPAKRVITLAPSLTEMIFEIGAQDRLVGTVQHSNFPEAAKRKPRIGNHERFVMERVVSMQPDLVIAWASANNARQLQQLETLKIPVYRSEPRSLSDISKTITNLGILTGHQVEADKLAGEFNRRLEKLRESNSSKPRLKTFYQVWHQPVYTVNGEHVISKIMNLCGLVNIFAEAKVLAPKVTVESVIKHNPDIIIASGMARAQPEWLDKWRKWPAIHAVANNNLFFIDPDLIQRQSTRILDAAEIMCQQADQARIKRLKRH